MRAVKTTLVAHKIDGNHDATGFAWPLDADDRECQGMWVGACEEKLTSCFERNHTRAAIDDRRGHLQRRALLCTKRLSEPQTQQHDAAC